jgi:hypothetical protein
MLYCFCRLCRRHEQKRRLLYETKACYECVASAIAFLENKYVIAAANPKINIIRRAQWAIGKQNRFCRMKLLN